MKLIIGLLKCYYIVVYLYGKLKLGFDVNMMNKKFQLEFLEIDVCVWLDRDLVKCIMEVDEEKVIEYGYKIEGFVGKGEYVR